ncbi:MAG TPA: tRNA threonylcarbamoyladenosine dehydratase [Candidatus Cloacimonadota bacterium]|nr:tRNA threonylcarbamoyladenosine dehydratase [Candidatus Cloacimonadota bacterium]
MSREQDIRTELLLGAEGLAKLYSASVAVVGLGGVGGYALEALVRAGVGRLTIVDFDVVQLSNINRQLIADHQSVGLAKTELFQRRIREINPDAQVNVCNVFINKENCAEVLSGCGYLLDAIDCLEAKTDLLEFAFLNHIQAVTVFGAGRRLDPFRIQTGDISKTHGCPLARRTRKALRDRGISSGIKAVFSTEEPLAAIREAAPSTSRQPIGSISYMPAIMGLRAAAELIRIIIRDE